ncbi:MAG: hypothetical protein LC126_27200 [Bryobacterales bacterium]|nr:hypothetical protein [Bryobacterales bacterium]
MNRHYSYEEIEHVLLRNRLLFQLRNFTAGGTDDAASEVLAKAPEPVVRFFTRRATQWSIARARVWNHRATISDRDVLDGI